MQLLLFFSPVEGNLVSVCEAVLLRAATDQRLWVCPESKCGFALNGSDWSVTVSVCPGFRAEGVCGAAATSTQQATLFGKPAKSSVAFYKM